MSEAAANEHNATNISGKPAEYLSFRVGENEYSVDIMSVREIRGWTPATSLPHSPSYVRGVINLRGTVLAVIDLALRLGLAETEPEDRNVIIVVDSNGKSVGLRVDEVSDILTIAEEQIQPPPNVSDNNTFVKGLTVIEDRMIRIIDLHSVLPDAEEVAA